MTTTTSTPTIATIATIATFDTILIGGLTQYDKRVSKRNPNTNRLGLLFEAAARARAGLDMESDDPAELLRYVAGIERSFLVNDLTPARNTIKAIRAWLNEGKRPKYPVEKKR